MYANGNGQPVELIYNTGQNSYVPAGMVMSPNPNECMQLPAQQQIHTQQQYMPYFSPPQYCYPSFANGRGTHDKDRDGDLDKSGEYKSGVVSRDILSDSLRDELKVIILKFQISHLF